ncbi:response regulator [Kineosporia sp. NBRC 101677]|uniref:response regulator n=1 Tax=Kineosporia sp. NBRC 101677 TaxID=3032197 RepID=UPI0024A2943C|nr:response regulator [Kineosporia sp. NBRC 101677]GLY14656.1 response regulator [Kineosporia sp. NBRC 101677]
MSGVVSAAGVNNGPIGELQPWLLLVEDSPHDRELALHALRRGRFPGRVESARDGVEALDLLLGRGPWAGRDLHDLPRAVLLDIKMPMVSGIDVLREMRAHPVLSEVPVVMMTSSAEDGDLETCYALGANSYIVKPVEIEPYFETVLDIGRYWLVHNHPPRDRRVVLAGGGR